MNYNKIIYYCNKYNIKRYTDLGKPLTHNKLKNIINDHANKKRNTYYEIIPFCQTSEYNELDILTELPRKKHKLSEKQKIYNSILNYLEDAIDENELNNAMHHYVGN